MRLSLLRALGWAEVAGGEHHRRQQAGQKTKSAFQPRHRLQNEWRTQHTTYNRTHLLETDRGELPVGDLAVILETLVDALLEHQTKYSVSNKRPTGEQESAPVSSVPKICSSTTEAGGYTDTSKAGGKQQTTSTSRGSRPYIRHSTSIICHVLTIRGGNNQIGHAKRKCREREEGERGVATTSPQCSRERWHCKQLEQQ